jgi:hypothetical protein
MVGRKRLSALSVVHVAATSAETPLLNAVWPVVTGVMSAATSPRAGRWRWRT